MPILAIFVAAVLMCHAGLGWILHAERPELGILPPLPNERAVRALSFGDAQYLFRAFTFQIQNAGDTGGRFTPMAKYDMAAVVRWLEVLQKLDVRSNYYPVLAVRYFSQSGKPEALRLLIDFIDRDFDLAPDRKWFWQTQAVAMARDRLKDIPYALDLSRKLLKSGPFIPPDYFWALELEPILLADLGRKEEAREAMERALRMHGENISVYDKNWIAHFLAQLKK